MRFGVVGAGGRRVCFGWDGLTVGIGWSVGAGAGDDSDLAFLDSCSSSAESSAFLFRLVDGSAAPDEDWMSCVPFVPLSPIEL